MIYIIKTINGQKVAVPLTADTGSGNPVGTIIAQYKKTNMAGYLYLDGRDTTGTADELQTVYPALYAYLGNTNVLPDYREFALVGAEENTTSTNIATHDTFTQGQEKDDQLQDHKHAIGQNAGGSAGVYGISNYFGNYAGETDVVSIGRKGDVTRGKRKAVYFYIKATSGLTESQMDSMITILNQQRSYSETETDTGKKWIDGKTIYRKVVDCGALPNNTTKAVAHNVTNLYQVVKIYGIVLGNNFLPLPFTRVANGIDLWATSTEVKIETYSDRSQDSACVTIEYTKSS